MYACVLSSLFVVYLLGTTESFKFPATMRHKSCSSLSMTLSVDELTAFEEITKQATMALSQAPENFKQQMDGFLTDYKESNIASKYTASKYKFNLLTFLKSIQESFKSPYKFQPYHKAIREPLDYYSWGNDFFKSLMIFDLCLETL